MGCRWYACCPAGAVDTITLNGKREVGHESGLTDQGLLDGAHDVTLVELRQTWPRRGDEFIATCVYGSTNQFQMVRVRGPRQKFGAAWEEVYPN